MKDDESPVLRHLFRDAPAPTFDVAAITRRSRARRLPKLLGIGAAGIIAIGGVGVVGVQTSLGFGQNASTSALESTGADSGAANFGGAESQFGTPFPGSVDNQSIPSAQYDSKRSAAEYINRCGSAPVEAPASALGLALSVDFARSASASSRIDGKVTLTNASGTAISGYSTAEPAITLARGGVVVWHSTALTSALEVPVELAPGESMTYAVSVAPVLCTADDETDAGFRSGLPPLTSGAYEISAAIDVMGVGDADLVMSPASVITLR
jgi:hypothetical protein